MSAATNSIKPTADQFKITISTLRLALDAQICVSKNQARHYLNGFCVEKAENGIILVSTDGHRMVVLHDPDGSIDLAYRPIVRLPKHFLDAAKVLIAENYSLTLEVAGTLDESTATIKTGDGAYSLLQCSDVLIDGVFPDWRKTLPILDEGKPFISAEFNSRYFSDFGELCSDGSRGVTAFGNTTDGPHLIRITDRDDVFGVLMPRRMSMTPTFPSWLGGSVSGND